MILSGLEIKKEIKKGSIKINPFDEKKLNPNSYNVILDNKLRIYKSKILDMLVPNIYEDITITNKGFILQPNELYLGKTLEYTETNGFVPILEGRSSIARLGICIHITAGFGDNGFRGYWTLEITCVKPVKIYPYIEIGQLYYYEIKGEQTFYSGKYQDNKDIQPSLLYSE